MSKLSKFAGLPPEERARLLQSSINENALVFKTFSINETKIEEIINMNFLIDGIIVKGYHHYIYGKAGSGKTTIMMHLCREIAKKHPEIMIHFLYFDGSLNMAAKNFKLNKKIGIGNFFIIQGLTTTDMINEFGKLIKNKQNLSNMLFVLDTYKYLTADINNKNANKNAMHLIKSLTQLGATFISIGHTNKDNKAQSGTAEIEQDSDALLRIDSTDMGDGCITSTIKRAGRCRFEVKEQSFKFKGGEVEVQSLNQPIDVSGITAYKEQYNKDIEYIKAMKLLLKRPLHLSEILKQYKEYEPLNMLGNNKIRDLLKRYTGKEWITKRLHYAKNKIVYECKNLTNLNNSTNLTNSEI